MEQLHVGHIGIESTLRRAREHVYWFGMTNDITQMIETCRFCQMFKNSPAKEPIIQHQVPENPWQKVAADLFQIGSENYLVIVDYFSNYAEVIKLRGTTSTEIISALKHIFQIHGIPIELVTDNGPQFTSREFKN